MKRKEKKASIGCLFWIALILLVLVVFLFNKNTINTVLERTGFIEVVEDTIGNRTPPEVKRVPSEDNNETESPRPEAEQKPEPAAPQESPVQRDEESEGSEDNGITVQVDPEVEKAPDEKPREEVRKVRNARLYFVGLNDEGIPQLKGIVRPIYFTDSPLTDTLKALLGGLTPSEMNQGLLTLIPDGTEILSVQISDGVAVVNFNEQFRFNNFGAEGISAQLMQIVYTATEFATVDSVQILINNEKREYLGPEGGFIQSPLSRASF